jgi:N utilization substance protein B
MGKRRRARELAIQVLYHLEYNPGNPDESFDTVCKSFQPRKEIRAFAKELVVGVWTNKEALDRLISSASKNWRIERMSRVDRNILRLAVFEVLYLGEIPPKVSIDEAVELSKKYGTEDSGAFVNGVLDYVYNTLEREGGTSEADP